MNAINIEHDNKTISDSTVVFKNVSKWFGSLVALNDVSFTIGAGITGLLGPNGSGKTTLLRTMGGLISPSQGTVSLFGSSIREDIRLYNRIGLLSEHENGAYMNLTGKNFLTTICKLRSIGDVETAVNNAINYVDMNFAKDRYIRGYSRGMKQRIRLAAILVHDPDVLVLDEPFNGTDPKQRLELQDIIKNMAKLGKTVLISSHILDELEQMASNVIVLISGKVAATGSVKGIRASLTERPYEIRISVSSPREVASKILTLDSVESIKFDDGDIVVSALKPSQVQSTLPQITKQLGVRLTKVVPLDDSLQSIFGYLRS